MFLPKKIENLVDSCLKNSQVVPHILLVTSDISIARRFARNLTERMKTKLAFELCGDISYPGDLAGVLTNLVNRGVLFLEDISKLNSNCLEYWVNAVQDFKWELPIDSGIDARRVQVKLNEFTLVATTPKISSINRKLLGSFFCVIKESDIREVSALSVLQLLKKFDADSTGEAVSYLISIANDLELETESFLKNILNYSKISSPDYDGILNNEIIDNYIDFSGIKHFKNSNPSRVISSDVKREVWKRDSGVCVSCNSQDRLEFDHIICPSHDLI